MRDSVSAILQFLLRFIRIWIVDTEYRSVRGAGVTPICIVGHELRTGATYRRWTFGQHPGPPPWNPHDPATLIVSYSVPAECGFFAALGWAQPSQMFDSYARERHDRNGVDMGSSLLEALARRGISTPTSEAVKVKMTSTCAYGSDGEITANRQQITDYCAEDVAALLQLFIAQVGESPVSDYDLYCGEYGIACAEMEAAGIPVDVDRLAVLARRWDEVRRIAAEIATTRMRFRIFGGEDGTGFSFTRFEEYLRRTGLLQNWPLTEKGHQLATDNKTLKQRRGRHPDLEHLRIAKQTIGMRGPSCIAVGPDGRSRTGIRPWAAVTSRNLPKASTPLAFPSWMRALITPPRGLSLGIFDYAQQEPAVAASLSGDEAMMADYRSGDFYVAFGSRAGHVPGAARDTWKVAGVSVMYGATLGLADTLGVDPATAAAIVAKHKRSYPAYWRWSAGVSMYAAFVGRLESSLGWRAQTIRMTDLSRRNFPLQSAGADILRLAVVLARRAGVRVLFPIHDALVFEAPEHAFPAASAEMRRVMVLAGKHVAGVQLRIDEQVIRHGDRYHKSDKAKDFWTDVWQKLGYPP